MRTFLPWVFCPLFCLLGCGDDGEAPRLDGGLDVPVARDGSGEDGSRLDGGTGDTGSADAATDGAPADTGSDAGEDSGADIVSMPCTAAGACDPFSDDSCPGAELCLPGDDGTTCRPGSEGLPEGATCTTPTSCAPGMLCVLLGDTATCQRMCPGGSVGFCEGEQRCSGGLAGEDCIRYCRLRAAPCDILAQDCASEGDACTLATDPESLERYTGCRPSGEQTLGEVCGGGMGACVRGTICIRSAGVSACRQVCDPDEESFTCEAAAQTCSGLSTSWRVSYCREPPA